MITYTLEDLEWIAASQLVRWRSRYHGVKESYKINLEVDQIAFDLGKLLGEFDDLADALARSTANLYEGVTLTGVDFWDDDQATNYTDVELPGLDTLVPEVEQLTKRVKTLENK